MSASICITGPGVSRRRRALALVALCAMALAAVVAVHVLLAASAHDGALSAAGAFAHKGGSIHGLAKFVDKVRGNLIWAISVLAGLMVVAVGGMFLTGHRHAHEYALKALVGFLIVAGSSGIVA